MRASPHRLPLPGIVLALCVLGCLALAVLPGPLPEPPPPMSWPPRPTGPAPALPRALPAGEDAGAGESAARAPLYDGLDGLDGLDAPPAPHDH